MRGLYNVAVIKEPPHESAHAYVLMAISTVVCVSSARRSVLLLRPQGGYSHIFSNASVRQNRVSS